MLLRSISFRRFLFFLDFRFLFPIWAQSFPTPSRSRTKRSQLPNSSSTSESIWIKVCPAINSLLLHSFMFMVKTSLFKIVFNFFFSKIVQNLFWNMYDVNTFSVFRYLETYQRLSSSSKGRTSPLQMSNYESAISRVAQFRNRRNSVLKPAEANSILEFGADLLTQVSLLVWKFLFSLWVKVTKHYLA